VDPNVRLGITRCAAAAVLFGATTPLAGRLADDTSAPILAGLLYVGAATAVVPWLPRRPIDPRALGRRAPRLGAAVVFGGLLGPLCLTAGLQRTPGATASLLLNLELVATALLAAVLFREHLGRRIVEGTLLVVAAGAVLAWAGAPELRAGAVLIVLACVCWGIDNCVTATLDLAPEHITAAKGVVAGGTNLAIGLLLGGQLPSAGVMVAALAVGAAGYGLSITLWVAGARDLGAARGQLVFSTAPFVGVVVAWAVLGDDVRRVELIALALAALGVARVVGSGHEHAHRHHAIEHDHEHSHDDRHHEHAHHVELAAGRHSHRHTHVAVTHAHPHVPDLHHRHDH
jgi:drug/metabolite transporter (DMT)-like permease